ncbi:uncharacterized protein LOC133835233 [Drosophila sulfurigaster albostrigata]|uniref:uncharacterized protein LOC133835233 n=1 Tax=Drosophila sulfurigaster albostrigata TaxID=89887 RepID=UPI002D21DD3E|nr:uncharacterized protein LOC133835233 [Drosophila sulfurigaster albostrigata]
MTMRLNLDHILRSQLMDKQQFGDHHLARATDKEKSTLRLGAGKSEAYKYLVEKGNVGTRVNSMISSIHQHMKITAPPRKSVPAVPAPIAQIPVEASISKTSAAKKMRRIKGGGGTAVASNKAMPLSRMKARINQQSQQIMRRGYVDLNPTNYTNQRRIREVLVQKTVLENMLLQHKRLQRDRQTIALDIQRMRQDLDKIKNKLDTSMEALKSTRTLYSGFNKGKKGLLPLGLPTNATLAVKSGSKIITKTHSAKSSKIIAKRQHTPSTKKMRARR